MKITVFGTGYVGLVQGAVLAEAGHHVICIDTDADKIKNLENGVIPIYEPGLSQIVEQCSASGHLRFSTDAALGVSHGEIQFIAVGTPPDEDGSADLQYVLAVAKTIAINMTATSLTSSLYLIPTAPLGVMSMACYLPLSRRRCNRIRCHVHLLHPPTLRPRPVSTPMAMST